MGRYFPIFLDLGGKRCVVVGAGKVAARKIAALLDAGATVEVVSPEADVRIRQWAEKGKIRWQKKTFAETDLQEAFLVIGAAGDSRVNREVFEAAGLRGLLVNIVDDPKRCNFIVPGTLRRGQFQIAVSTGGACPMLTRKVREELQRRFGPRYGEVVSEIASIRMRLAERLGDQAARKRFWKDFVDLDFFDRLEGDNIAQAVRERALQCLSRLEE